MKTIYKYSLLTTDEQTLRLPKCSIVLTMQMQGDTPCVWALVDTSQPLCDIKVLTFSTGSTLVPDDTSDLNYIGTYQIISSLVFHVFYVIDYEQ